jgi:hypothetical protein
MAEIVRAPEPYDLTGKFGVFLAGTIDMGKGENWQPKAEEWLGDLDKVIILNPRRLDWDSSWEQTIKNAKFREQVQWELAAQENSSLIFMYFSPGSQSPITFLEYGLFLKTGKVIPCCPEGFWRKGNLEVTCEYYNIPLYEDLIEGLDAVRNRLLRGIK